MSEATSGACVQSISRMSLRSSGLRAPTFSDKGEKEESRRLGEVRIEMLQPRHHFLLQQAQRMVPRLRLVLVVEAEHQERAEAADLVVDFFDLLGDGRGRADDPVVAGAIVDGDVGVGDVGCGLEIILETEM